MLAVGSQRVNKKEISENENLVKVIDIVENIEHLKIFRRLQIALAQVQAVNRPVSKRTKFTPPDHTLLVLSKRNY